MTKLENGLLIVDLCNLHEKPSVYGFICGSVLKWKCKKCKRTQQTNPHYAEHQKYVCEECRNK